MTDIPTILDQIQYVHLSRWMKRAQRSAALEWRDREIPPGVACRFTSTGKQFYGFSDRRRKYRTAKGNRPDYVKTGTFRNQVLHRRPTTRAQGGGLITTKLSIDGGALNLLTNVHGVRREVYLRQQKRVTVSGYTQVRTSHGKGGSSLSHPVQVRSYQQTRTGTKAVIEPAARTYREEFGIIAVDREFMAYRTSQNFEAQVRGAAFTKNGQLRKNVRLKFRGEDDEVA